MSISVGFEELNKIRKYFGAQKPMAQKALDAAMRSAQTQVPKWVETAVRENRGYNIQDGDIAKGNLGKIYTRRKGFKADIAWYGRKLTPTHFNMSPASPISDGYTLTAQIRTDKTTRYSTVKTQHGKRGKKGSKKSKKSPIMLMHTGAKSQDKVQYIPFQRKSTYRKDIIPIKPVSMPQMISKDGVTMRPEIAEYVMPKLQKAMERNIERYMGK